jgi:DNA-binding NarL/FixJ family response regulator
MDYLHLVVADDHPLLRQGVRMLLEATLPGCTVAEAGDLASAKVAVGARPDAMLLIDLNMPGMEGTETLHALRREFPATVMAVLSGTADRRVILDALAAGMNGYILKSSDGDEIAQAVRMMQDGQLYVTPTLVTSLSEYGRGADEAARGMAEAVALPPMPAVPHPPNRSLLTPRQTEVIRLLAQGRSNKEIERALGLSEGTVKAHLAAAFRSLGARNRTEAVVLANRLGL